MKKRVFSALLAVFLLAGLIPSASAAEISAIQSLSLRAGDTTARVRLDAQWNGSLLVALYDGQGRMLHVGESSVHEGDQELTVSLPAPAPEVFTAQAFLLDGDHRPLCKSLSADPDTSQPPQPSQDGKVLIAYFSATNNTENIANHLNAILDAGLYEIVPEVPYTSADLNYNTDCRANREQNDPSARPAISGGVDNMAQYDVIFLGYPIWWGQAPKIIYTFLENYDLSGKTIVPFCTSGSSGIGSSATNLHTLAGAAAWLDGQRFSGSASHSTVETWVNSLGLMLHGGSI